jgi:outer membrane cobalamin receptor
MKPFRLFLVICFVFLFISAFSQIKGTFSGKITDKQTGESLVGASIFVKADMTIGVVSDINGNFNIKANPGEYYFTISFTGMKTINLPLKIVADSTILMNIEMEPFSVQFDEVVVRSGKFDKPLEEQTVSVSVMQSKMIESKNTRSVETILDMTPGLTILDQEPQIRGGSGFTFGVGSKVAVFVDDMPVVAGDAGKPDWSLIPVENIEQIEVVKGASSVLSGSSALSGAIYIRSKYPGTTPETNIKVFGGMFTAPREPATQWWNGVNYIGGVTFLHTEQVGDHNTDLVIGGAFLTDRSYIGAPVPGPYVNDTANITDKDMENRKGRINFNIRRRSIKIKGLNYGLNGNLMYKKGSTALAWLDDTANFYRAYPGAVLLANAFTGYIDPYVNFYTRLGTKHTFNNRIFYNNNHANNNQSSKALMIYNNYQVSKTFAALGNLDFIGGVASQSTFSTADLYQASGSDKNWIWNLSAYIELEKKIANTVTISGGVRLEYFNLNDSIKDTKPIFRFGTSWKMGQETYLRASIGQGYRFPSITERYIKTTVGSFGVFDNPDLIPETSWNAEVGLKQGFKFAKFYGYFDAAFFYQEYNNTIEYLFGFWDSTYTFALAGFKFVNTGESQVTGIDLSMTGQAKFRDHYYINLMAGYTYVMPITLTPDYIFATDYNPGGAKDFNYVNTSVNPDRNILKYRFLGTAKVDVEVGYKGIAFGISMKYYSKIENLDQAIFDFQDATISSGGTLQPLYYENYFYNENNGNTIFDMRLSYHWGMHKMALISDNVFNTWYSLRPLKAEPMRSITIQYSLSF